MRHLLPVLCTTQNYFSSLYSCLQVINQMVSGGSFALLAEFLPGIKVLIQVASQLGVYVKRPQ